MLILVRNNFSPTFEIIGILSSEDEYNDWLNDWCCNGGSTQFWEAKLVKPSPVEIIPLYALMDINSPFYEGTRK